MTESILSVSQLNQSIRLLLESNPQFQRVCVRGELSNYKIHSSGHHYFTLKDAESSIRCVMFRSQAARLRFRPESGLTVILSGRITVYQRDGAYQIVADSMMPEGTGDLQLAFEQLKKSLQAEGLFDAAHKKPIARYPKRIAVITSGTGAAVRDIIRVAGKRWPMTELVVMSVRVQGAGAAAEIAGAIRYADRWKVADLIITGRGGGSLEDLWPFNEEIVARAIYDCSLPVISAVGHEPDVTIADYVADLRAATPSNAAELALPDQNELMEQVRSLQIRLDRAMNNALSSRSERIREIISRPTMQNPLAYIQQLQMRLDSARTQLLLSQERTLSSLRRPFTERASKLDALSPLKVLSRGFALISAEDRPITDIRQLSPGDRIRLQLHNGAADCITQEVYPHEENRTDL